MTIEFKKRDFNEISDLVQLYVSTLKHPLDSYMEDLVYTSALYSIEDNGTKIGFFALKEEDLIYFYVKENALYQSAKIFLKVVESFSVKRVLVISTDNLVQTLLIEWDHDRARMACFFIDGKQSVKQSHQLDNPVFKTAQIEDEEMIRSICGDFFDDESSGYETLLDRIKDETIFILSNEKDVYGFGIIEKGRICKGYASIGMFANKEHRQKGVAKTILLNLKDYVYNLDLEPIAGCWYYNTLSKASLESAGMVAATMGYWATLKGKDNPPKRTGNPPGELVE